MKIALIYSGHLRTWEECKENHRMNLWDANCDLFFYTYDDPRCAEFHRFTRIPEEAYYHPTFDNGHPFHSNKRPETTIHNTLNQWHNNFTAWAITPKGYDIYVRIRPDIRFDGMIYLRNYTPDVLGEKTIYIPEGNDYGGVNDQFAFGDYNAMRVFYEVYLNHAKLWGEGIEFHSEGVQLENLRKEGVTIKRLPTLQHIHRK
jgi:hypothetical protein